MGDTNDMCHTYVIVFKEQNRDDATGQTERVPEKGLGGLEGKHALI